MELKYNFKELLDSLSRKEYGSILDQLKSKGIYHHNLYHWSKITRNSKSSIPFDKALDFAEILKIDVNDLHNRSK